MILNPDKCHFMTLGVKNANIGFQCNNTIIKNSPEEKILGITIDNTLSFKGHLDIICKVANQKLNT